jgi:ppGpp synthetase/RelA/SpoT-type nucleotidyltranferase
MALPSDCSQFVTSASAVDRNAEFFREDPTNSVALRGIQCYRLFRVAGLEAFLDAVVEALPNENTLMGARLKRVPSILRKLEREQRMRLSRMADVVGLRILCGSVEAAKHVTDALRNSPSYLTSHDYRSNARSSGYRACHLIYSFLQEGTGGTPLRVTGEIQVRTYFQHLWALVSESLGEQVKEGAGQQETREYLARLSAAIARREESRPDEVQQEFSVQSDSRDLLVVRMPKGSSPIHLKFGREYRQATAQLLRWESDPGGGATETLLLLGIGNLSNLARTHATFLGMRDVPLPRWMHDEVVSPEALVVQSENLRG